jgi:L-serine dehydratase
VNDLKLPKIFNDVMGPVMRGQSSSHTAASWRIARVCLDILDEPLKSAVIEFDRHGAWATNYVEQGTAMGIMGGLLGLDITDSRMKNTGQLADDRGLTITFRVGAFPTQHVNTVRLTLTGNSGEILQACATSNGGGTFHIYNINGHQADIRGDYHELLVWSNSAKPVSENIQPILPKGTTLSSSSNKRFTLTNIKSPAPVPSELIQQIAVLPGVEKMTEVNPILPIVSGNETALPFTTISSMISYAENKNCNLGQMGLIYEKCLSGLPEQDLRNKMKAIIGIINSSINTGLEGTEYQDRILHQQSHLIKRAEADKKIPAGSVMNNIISNVTAIMEVKSAIGVFVANPTAGSSGAVGGVLRVISEELNSSEDELIDAYFAAGIVGAFFAAGPGFSAEEHGCQVECGAASGMAAAGIAHLFGGTARQAIGAASMAIQHMIGLICDPVADRVEVPCLGKNINAAVNAYASATMACSGFDAVIPLEEVLETVEQVGNQMPACVKCTGKGGLSITNTALELKRKLEK